MTHTSFLNLDYCRQTSSINSGITLQIHLVWYARTNNNTRRKGTGLHIQCTTKWNQTSWRACQSKLTATRSITGNGAINCKCLQNLPHSGHTDMLLTSCSDSNVTAKGSSCSFTSVTSGFISITSLPSWKDVRNISLYEAGTKICKPTWLCETITTSILCSLNASSTILFLQKHSTLQQNTNNFLHKNPPLKLSKSWSKKHSEYINLSKPRAYIMYCQL